MIRPGRLAIIVSIAAYSIGTLWAQSTVSTVPFNFPDRGGASWTTVQPGSLTVGYGRIETDPGVTPPSGVSIFSYRQNNAVATEAAVALTPTMQAGRTFAQVEGPINTAVAIANPGNQPALVNFVFTDSTGVDFRNGTLTVPANGQIAGFLSGPLFGVAGPFIGMFSFTSSSPIAVTALRTLINERGEFLISALTTEESATTAPVGASMVYPYFVDGGGWTTELLLLNPSEQTIGGAIQFILPDTGEVSSTLTYSIPSHGAQRLQTAGNSSIARKGSVRVSPDTGNKTPSLSLELSYAANGIHLTQTGIARAGTAAASRVYVEANDAIGLRTALVLTNPSPVAVTTVLELVSLSGITMASGSLTLQPSGQVAMFISNIPNFTQLPPVYQAVLRVTTSSTSGISMLAIRERRNERNELLYTAVPATDESAASQSAASRPSIFPHIAEGSGYSTQFAIYGVAPGSPSSGLIRFLSQSGANLSVPIIDTARAFVPALQLAYPDRGFPGTTMNVTLYGSNFATQRTDVGVTGTGVRVSAVSGINATSMTATLIVDPSAPLGDRSLTVTTSAGTSNPVPFTIKNVATMIAPAQVTVGQSNVAITVTAAFESIDRFNLGGLGGVQFYLNGQNDSALTTSNVQVQGDQINALLNVGANAIPGLHTIVLITPSGNIPSLGSLSVSR